MDFFIRPIEQKDAKGVNALRRMPGVFENILGIPSERIKRNEDYIMNMGQDQHSFVAVTINESGDEVVIGTAGMSVLTNHRTRHSAGIGIMVHKDFQGQGVGKSLLQALLDIADNWLMLVRVELTVFCDNEKAIKLYEKLGFVKEGTKRMAAIRNGRYVDEYIMARINQNVIPK